MLKGSMFVYESFKLQAHVTHVVTFIDVRACCCGLISTK